MSLDSLSRIKASKEEKWNGNRGDYAIFRNRLESWCLASGELNKVGNKYLQVLHGKGTFGQLKYQPFALDADPQDEDDESKTDQQQYNKINNAIHLQITQCLGRVPMKKLITAGVRAGDGRAAFLVPGEGISWC